MWLAGEQTVTMKVAQQVRNFGFPGADADADIAHVGNSSNHRTRVKARWIETQFKTPGSCRAWCNPCGQSRVPFLEIQSAPLYAHILAVHLDQSFGHGTAWRSIDPISAYSPSPLGGRNSNLVFENLQ